MNLDYYQARLDKVFSSHKKGEKSEEIRKNMDKKKIDSKKIFKTTKL